MSEPIVRPYHWSLVHFEEPRADEPIRERPHRWITLERTGDANENSVIPGLLRIGQYSWPTMERAGYTWVRKGNYYLKMDYKRTKRRVRCLRLHHEGLDALLIHDAYKDRVTDLEGCIAPGRDADEHGVKESALAMENVFDALGGYVRCTFVRLSVLNNVFGDQTAREWIARRRAAGKQ